MDEQGFRQLYEQYNRPIYTFFVRRGFSKEESRDMVQETFLAAFSGWQHFRGESTLYTWVFGIAKNIWRNQIREGKRQKRDAQVISLDVPSRDDDDKPTYGDRLTDGGWENQPLDRFLRVENNRLLNDALLRLPEKTRWCLVLYLRGYKYREIADILKVSINTVRSQIFDARAKLRKELADHFTLGSLEGRRHDAKQLERRHSRPG